QRRAQLVTDVGEKLRFVTVSGLELLVLVLDFLEQAHVLDGDDRLIGKGFQKSDLLIGEGSDLGAANTNDPQRNALTQQGRGEYCPMAEPLLSLLGVGKLGFDLCCPVMDFKGLPSKYRSAG